MALTKNKKLLMVSSVITAGALGYLLFKKGTKISFYDNVWCANPECSNIDPISYVAMDGETRDEVIDDEEIIDSTSENPDTQPEVEEEIVEVEENVVSENTDTEIEEDQVSIDIVDSNTESFPQEGEETEITPVVNMNSEENNTGSLNLIFSSPHGLSAGEDILIKQSGTPTFEQYDGWKSISYVYNDYIIRLDTPRLGSTPKEGGTVQRDSLSKRIF